jgi:hypothetical protein
MPWVVPEAEAEALVGAAVEQEAEVAVEERAVEALVAAHLAAVAAAWEEAMAVAVKAVEARESSSRSKAPAPRG